MLTIDDLAQLLSSQLLAELERQRFFGNITFQFREGKLYLVRREETVRTERMTRTNRHGGTDGRQQHD